MTAPTFVSLFAGIGGLDLGLERAGWRCVAQVEIDPFCQRVLARHWPDVPRWGDIREVVPDDFPRPDLVCGGFPCQPVSLAGRRRGQTDERWLWPHMARVVRQLRPAWVLVENVPGLLVPWRDEGGWWNPAPVEEILGDLAACGYDAEWDCVPASAVGANHRRDRVWIVGYPQRGGRLGADPYHGEHITAGRAGRVDAVDGRVAGQAGRKPRVLADTDGQAGRPAARPAVAGAGAAPLPVGPPQPGRRGSDVADPDGQGRWQGSRLGWPRPTPERDGWWTVEPTVGRMAPRLPDTVDRLTALGNAVVPQVAEHIGRLILAAHQREVA